MAKMIPAKCVLVPMRKTTIAEDALGQSADVREQVQLEAQRSEDERFREMYIQVARYDPSGQHTEIESILRQLCVKGNKFKPSHIRIGLERDLPQ
jgi:hypothetical protein